MLEDGKLLVTNETAKQRNRRLVLVGLLIVGLTASALILRDALKPSFAADYRDYPSVEALEGASDVVVAGQLGESIGEFEDRGGDPEVDEFGDPIPGIPMEVFSFTVSRSSILEIAPGDVIPVLWIDLDAVNAEGVTPLRAGDDVVLFLKHLTPASAPDLAKFGDEAWVPVSGDNGVMDLNSAGDAAHPRSSVMNEATVSLDDVFK